MKVWLFGTYKWQGNPKALFLYMTKHYANTHDCWWITDNPQDAEQLKKIGINNVTYAQSIQAQKLFKIANVYVNENFREIYPDNLSSQAVIFNTWHGVGLKHIELALGEDSVLAESIVKKYIKNYKLYKNNTYFLATSAAMEQHFIEDTAIDRSKMIRGGYPRNEVYKSDIATFSINDVLKKSRANFSKIILFAPTYRVSAINGVFQYLLPDLKALHSQLQKSRDLLIVKVHPFMTKDEYFQEMKELYAESDHILFWNDDYDIYEIFNQIDIAIVDYSSIFYDLLDAGVNKFIRYIPDYNQYSQELELLGDYFRLTSGKIANNFTELLNILDSKVPTIKNKKYLMQYFFGYKNDATIDQIIQKLDGITIDHKEYTELHSFDVFDTLIRRKTLTPFSIFYYVQTLIKESGLPFPDYLVNNWVEIRNQAEHDVRDMYRKTLFERGVDTIEITLDDIYDRIQRHMNLSEEQIIFLKNSEIQAEIDHVEPIVERIGLLFAQIAKGHDVILISDMYLPKHVIRKMLAQADVRLTNLPLYLSSEIGHQKSTGKIYKHIFFKNKYNYQRWVHYGDNVHADGVVPRRLGIETAVHHMDSFIPFESALIESMSDVMKYPAYALATKMQRYRKDLLCCNSNSQFDQQYYAYAYAGSALVPYVHWSILDAMQRGYEKLYFISRDGHFLKQIADQIIQEKGYALQTKYIYGSRKAWRIPSFISEIDNETFGPFGSFVGMDSFQDLVKASWLDEAELLQLFPEFNSLRHARHLRGEIAENIRKVLGNSIAYKTRILEIAAEKRLLVREYLQQEINFNEKFAFVEFWGRGYTQDTFSRLLDDAAGRPVLNPFYYVRSFSPDKGNAIRHNFILAPQNFSYFEPIFASTPYESISGYKKTQNGAVEPIINAQPNDIAAILETGLKDFTSDYLNILPNNEMNFAYSLASFTYSYQMKTHDDQFICNVFGALKDNVSSYGDVKEYAPELTVAELESIRDKKDLDVLTSSIPISLARSSDAVRKLYDQIHKKMKLPKITVGGMQRSYAVNPLDLYVKSDSVPFKAIAIKNNALFLDVSFSDASKRQDILLKQLDIFDVIAVDWLKNGVPRLLTPYGYVTAHKEWVQNLADLDSNKVKQDESSNYVLVTSAKKSTKQPVKIEQSNLYDIELNFKDKVQTVGEKTSYIISQIHSSSNTEELASEPSTKTDWQRKWNKFTRDPYRFFADAKDPKLTKLKYCFDEDHQIGRMLARWVRRNM